jgi:hypothetical protein
MNRQGLAILCAEPSPQKTIKNQTSENNWQAFPVSGEKLPEENGKMQSGRAFNVAILLLPWTPTLFLDPK